MNSLPPTELFSTLAVHSWRVAWLIALVLLLRVIVRTRIPAQVWFLIWIVLALRLLIPFSVSTAWSPYNLGRIAWETAPSAAVLPEAVAVAPVAAAESIASRIEALPAVSLPSFSPRTPALRTPRARWLEIAAGVWCAGVAGLVVVRALAARRFRRDLRRAIVADARVRAIAEREHSGVTCFETEAVAAPALSGFWRPRLLFPAGFAARLNDEELRLVVRHELAHWRRRDLVAQQLLQASAALHWFNPLAWLAVRLARIDCELACDEFVLGRGGADEPGAYGTTLLKVLGMVRGGRRTTLAIGILEGREQLAERVRRIAAFRAVGAGRVWGGIALVTLFAVVSVTRESRAERTAAPAAVPATGLATDRAASTPEIIERSPDAADVRHETTLEPATTPRTLADQNEMLAESLKAMKLEVQRKAGVVEAAEIRFNQVIEARARKEDLGSLPFIANQPLVAKLTEQRAAQEIELVKLRERYRGRHPKLIEAQNTFTTIGRERDRAIEAICRQIETEHQVAVRDLEQSRAVFDELKEQKLALDRRAVRLVAARNESAPALAVRAREQAPEETAAPPREREPAPAGDRFEVSIVGAVNTQSAVTLSARDTPIVLDAIARAGGFAANANRGGVRIIRAKPDGSRETMTLTEEAVMTGTDPTARLQRGDVIVVPEKPAPETAFVNVMGAVNKACRLELPPDRKLTIVDAISLAGGQSRLADLRKVQLTRAKSTGSNSVLIVDVQAIITRRGSTPIEDLFLEAGDIVFVPERVL